MDSGRPRIWKDGFYQPNQMTKVEFSKFESERHMKDFIIQNLDFFANDILGIKFKSFENEFKISDGQKKRKSIDLLIHSVTGEKIAIELKNPTYKSELQSALGQCLTYMTALDISGQKIDRMVLVSSVYDFLVPITISKMKLPVEFVVMDMDKFSKMSLI